MLRFGMQWRKQNKFGNKHVELDGHKFASKREAAVYSQYKLLERAGKIHRLEVHPVYKLVVNGVKIGRYTADLQYRDETGNLHVIDVKSKSTAGETAFRLRKRLVEALYPGVVIEVVF